MFIGPGRGPNVVPVRELTFQALKPNPPHKWKVVVFGRNPYPRPESATGIAMFDNTFHDWSDSQFGKVISIRCIIKAAAMWKHGIPKKTPIADIRALAKIAHKAKAWLCVDNCFLTPVLQQPLKLGADFVIHSATKYIDGQGRCVGGAIVGDAQKVGKEVFGFMRTAGPCMSPFNAWVFLKGLETLPLRMKAHGDNALKLAQWLQKQPKVTRVFYAGLKDHPQHALAKKQQSGFGGVLSFEVRGGRKAAWKLIDSTRMLSITANLGDTRSTITHPASTTHGRITPQARAAAGITEGLVRIAVGLEDIADIQADLAAGLR